MDIEKATFILKTLSEGVDPYTAEIYSVDSPYQKADTIRALYLGIEALFV